MSRSEADVAYLKTLTVLYVEDVPVVREPISQALRGWVGQLIVADSGPAGLEAFVEHQPDLVITDIVMPDGSGLAMAAAIRERAAQVPILVTTDYDNRDYLVRSIELGIAKYLFKPIDYPELEQALLVCSRQLNAEAQLARQREAELDALRDQHVDALNDLARGMGHDFNNLLQGILGALSVAKLSTQPSHHLYGILDLAEQSANQARELGRRLICLAKNAGPLSQYGPIGPLLKATVAAALEGSKVNVRYALPEDLGPVRYDEQRLATLVELLAVNAREAMAEGGVLEVLAEPVAVTAEDGLGLPAGPYLRTTLRDSGPGVPAELIGRIFDPYFTTKVRKNMKGVGLSLAICQAIARSHGGKLSLESQPGEGAAFHLHLPIPKG